MYSNHHAAVSLAVGGVVGYALEPVTVADHALSPVVLVGYAVAVGVLIDLDHFLLARLRTGDWGAVRFCLANPVAAVADQQRIFDPGDVGVLARLLSHLLIAGVLVAVAALVLRSAGLAILTGAVCYAHLVGDVAWDLRRLRRRSDVATTRLAD